MYLTILVDIDLGKNLFRLTKNLLNVPGIETVTLLLRASYPYFATFVGLDVLNFILFFIEETFL
jgi:hypothetical protein